MGNGVHISQKSKLRRHRKASKEELILVSGNYLHDFLIALTYKSKGLKVTMLKDFLPLFQQYAKGDNLKYFAPANFKKFFITHGNIYWGKNEDIIFPGSGLIRNRKSFKTDEEILYII